MRVARLTRLDWRRHGAHVTRSSVSLGWALLRTAVHACRQALAAGCRCSHRAVLDVVQSGHAKLGFSPLIAASCACLLQFAKAGSAASLSQQENNNSSDVQRGRVSIASFNCTSGKVTLAAKYLRRVRVVGRGFAVGAPPPTHVSTVVEPPPAAPRHCRIRRITTRKTYSGTECIISAVSEQVAK
jgi:hypothetical protein